MADFLVFVTVQPSAKPQQMMHRNGKKNAVSRRTTRDFRKNSENTSRNTSWLNCYPTVQMPRIGMDHRYIIEESAM